LTCGSDGERRTGNEWGDKISYTSTNCNFCQNTDLNMWDIIVMKDVFIFRATIPEFRGEYVVHPTSTLKKQGAGSFEKLVLTCKNTIDIFTW
jgi:hypothetical protein